MPVEEELKALDQARQAWRRIVFGQKQSIRRPQARTPASRGEQEERREQAQASAG